MQPVVFDPPPIADMRDVLNACRDDVLLILRIPPSFDPYASVLRLL
jgi:hypothetical protein